jgi:hypothetical protein
MSEKAMPAVLKSAVEFPGASQKLWVRETGKGHGLQTGFHSCPPVWTSANWTSGNDAPVARAG